MYISSIFEYTADLLGMSFSDGIQVASSGPYITLYGATADWDHIQARSIDLDGKQVMNISDYLVGDLETISVGSQERLFIADATHGTLHIGTVIPDGSVVDIAPVALPVSAPIQQVTLVPNNGQNLLASFTNSRDDFNIYEVGEDWTLRLAQTVTDTHKSYVSDVTQSVSHTIGTNEYLLTLSGSSNGISVFGFDAQGQAQLIDSIGIKDGLQISRGADMTVVTIDGVSIVVVAGQASSSISTLRLNENGVLFLADHYTDTSDAHARYASHLDPFTYADRQFLAVAGSDPGISIFEITQGGQLTLLTNIIDPRLPDVRGWSSVDVVVNENEAFILAAPLAGETLVQISLDLSAIGQQLTATSSDPNVIGTGLNDLLIGDDNDNRLQGGDGFDIIIDGMGQDNLIGGAGADMFIFVQDDGIDVIEDFEVGHDQIDLSQIGLVRNLGRLDISSTSDGAIIDFFGQTLILRSADGQSIEVADLTSDHFLLG